jgi:hypothetical protein
MKIREPLTIEEAKQRILELREQWKTASNTDRKILEKRGVMLKIALEGKLKRVGLMP